MNKSEKRQLVLLAKRFQTASKNHAKWVDVNGHRCGHSLTDDSLGDEGWAELHRRIGSSNSYFDAATSLISLIDKLERKTKKDERK